MQSDQAANELTEEQVLNFLVNTLDEEIDIELGENAEIDSEDFWDVLVGRRADEDSVSHLCEIAKDSPHGNTILHHLRTKFELAELERVGKTLIQQDILELLPDRPVEVVCDLHLRPYYGEEHDVEEELYESLAKTGTTTFHSYATLYARVRDKRYTLAVRRAAPGHDRGFGADPLDFRGRRRVPCRDRYQRPLSGSYLPCQAGGSVSRSQGDVFPDQCSTLFAISVISMVKSGRSRSGPRTVYAPLRSTPLLHARSMSARSSASNSCSSM